MNESMLSYLAATLLAVAVVMQIISLQLTKHGKVVHKCLIVCIRVTYVAASICAIIILALIFNK